MNTHPPTTYSEALAQYRERQRRIEAQRARDSRCWRCKGRRTYESAEGTTFCTDPIHLTHEAGE